MTQQEFFVYCQLPNHAGDVNVWYVGDNPSYIQGISVPILDDNGNDVSDILEQVEQISLPLPALGTTALLTITERTLTQSSDGLISYYFMLTEPYSTDDITSPTVQGDLIFSPGVNGIEFNQSPYNVLGGFVEDQRSSAYIMESDRYRVGAPNLPAGYTGPLNIYQLLSGSATLANVQDSNYSTTGWINARYNGSITNRNDYQSDPAVTGRLFKGATYALTTPDSQIRYQESGSQVVYRDFFYSGTENTPGFSVSNTNYETSASVAPATASYFFAKPDGVYVTYTNPFSIGDLILVDNKEVMRITLLGRRSTAPANSQEITIGVQRLVGGVYTDTTLGNKTIELLSQVQIFEFDRNKLNGLSAGKILVQETGEILVLDPLGFITAGSLLG